MLINSYFDNLVPVSADVTTVSDDDAPSEAHKIIFGEPVERSTILEDPFRIKVDIFLR